MRKIYDMLDCVRLLLCVLLLALAPGRVCAQAAACDGGADSLQTQGADSLALHPSEDFVRAYVIVASPGEILYSALGHAALRLECPAYGLDYIYSYEGEDTRDNILRFFAGKLQMRVGTAPTREYLQPYAVEGRGVVAYELHLPVAVKQRLWKQMDERVLEPPVPYDYMNRGCAISVSHWIRAAVDPDSLCFAPWPDKFRRTRKEMGSDSLHNEWTNFVLATITSGDAEDTDIPYVERITVPMELVEVMQNATAYGHPLLSRRPVTLLSQQREVCEPRFTPLHVALLFLLLSLCNLRLHSRCIRVFVWGFQFLFSMFVTYLVVFSSLPCTQWNWLLIPFNPLVVLLWRWRRHICIPYAAVCVLWVVGMIANPHRIVIPAHYVLVMSLAAAAIELWPGWDRWTRDVWHRRKG